MTATTTASRIATGAYLDAEERFEHAFYSHAVPAVIYQARLGGAVTRVEREGKGDHITLVRNGRTELVVASTAGVAGVLGYSHTADAWCVESFDGSWSFFGATRDAVIGEAGLHWIS